MIGIGPGQSYDESEEFEPKFNKKRWNRAFIQTRSNVRKLQPDTWFLYCMLHVKLHTLHVTIMTQFVCL